MPFGSGGRESAWRSRASISARILSILRRRYNDLVSAGAATWAVSGDYSQSTDSGALYALRGFAGHMEPPAPGPHRPGKGTRRGD